MHRNIILYPHFQFFRNLLFWQAVWFLYFESVLTAGEAILLAAIFDLSTVILEVPSGYFSDYLGRRLTLIIGMIASAAGCLLLFGASSFIVFAVAQVLLGAGGAFVSGTDTALLYDSLAEEGRQDEIAAQEVRAWRYSYMALAISAVAGGFLSTETFKPAYLGTAIALLAGLAIVILFREPSHPEGHAAADPWRQMGIVLSRVRDGALFWIFVYAVGAYVLSHVPFVFAQPYLQETLAKIGYGANAPIVSGLITAAMMIVSVAAGAFLLGLRKRIGTIGNLLLAMGMQVALILALAFVIHPAAIFLLVVRMVPDALSRPLLLAIVHPRIESGYRATYLSFQNLCGKLAFSGTLFLSAWFTSGSQSSDEAMLRMILPWYGGVGIVLALVLAVTAKRGLRQVE